MPLPLHIGRQIRAIREGRSTVLRIDGRFEEVPAVGKLLGQHSDLTRLEEVALQYCRLRAIPGGIRNLPNLRRLDLTGNPWTEIPSVVFRLRSLAHLDVSAPSDQKQGIREIPASILDLEKLESLDVGGQPIQTPPPEVVEGGLEAIRSYWRQQREEGVDYLCEAKLLIVGEPGAGKASLAKKIQDPDYALAPREASTEGIDVLRWRFPFALRIEKDGREELLQRTLQLNVWDFGGQEIYKATHQFFLTRRSLYALVADDRKEDTDFHYWLQAVELLSDGSPVIVVQNERQDRRRDLDFGRLRGRFESLVKSFRTNLADNRGLAEIRQAIQALVAELPLVGTPLPKTWKRVRDDIDLYARIRSTMDGILGTLKDMNALTPQQHRGTDFETLIASLRARLTE